MPGSSVSIPEQFRRDVADDYEQTPALHWRIQGQGTSLFQEPYDAFSAANDIRSLLQYAVDAWLPRKWPHQSIQVDRVHSPLIPRNFP